MTDRPAGWGNGSPAAARRLLEDAHRRKYQAEADIDWLMAEFALRGCIEEDCHEYKTHCRLCGWRRPCQVCHDPRCSHTCEAQETRMAAG